MRAMYTTVNKVNYRGTYYVVDKFHRPLLLQQQQQQQQRHNNNNNNNNNRPLPAKLIPSNSPTGERR